VYVHTCMKMHCYFLLNVKHGASQLYLGGLQLSSAGTEELPRENFEGTHIIGRIARSSLR